MAKKIKTESSERIEREYVIPLRKKYSHVPKHKRTPKAVRSVKEFLIRHMRIYERDSKKIKLDKYLNEFLWFRGIKNPPAKIKVRAIKDKGIVKVELSELPEKLRFKKIREERIIEKAEKAKKKKPAEEAVKEEQKPERTEEEKKEEGEKTKAVEESMKELEKKQAKQMKHQTKAKTRQPKRQQRKALAK